MSSRAVYFACAWSLLLGAASTCSAQLPSITTATVPNGSTGAAYSAQLAVTGGTPPYSNWTVGAGSLPPGLTLDPNSGRISGTITASGLYNFFITVQDSAGGISPARALTIAASVPVITTTSQQLPNAVLGIFYSFGLVASDGTPPYSNWTVTAGALPQGLSLNPSTGLISGTPITIGASNFSVIVQDSSGITSAVQRLSIVAGVAIITSSLPKGTLTAYYNSQLTAGGGTFSYTNWMVSSGELPPGLILAYDSGLVSGYPSTVGSYSFTITVYDTAGAQSAPQPFTIVIAPVPVVVTSALKSGLPGVPYSATLSASGGSAPLTWDITSGVLPTGLSFAPGTGIISGTPQSPAGTTFKFTVQVTDAAGVASAAQPLSIAITQAGLTLSSTSLAFTARLDDASPPPVQSVTVFSISTAVTFSAAVTTTTGGNWLNVNGGGRTPGSILVTVTTGGLLSNTTYRGLITLTGQNITPATIPVTLTIAASGPPVLSVSPSSLSLNYVQGNPAEQRYLIVENKGGGTIHFTAQASTDSCGSWLSLLTTAGVAIPSVSGVAAAFINPAGLSDKSCSGTITISDPATGQNLKVPIIMAVSSQSQSLLLTQAGMSFQTAVGGTPPSQTFSVTNTGVGLANWTATPQTLTGGNWLNVTPATGSSTSGVLPVPVTVSLNPKGLPPGQYFGSVQIASSTVGNSPQGVTVMLTVLDPPPAPPPLSPSGVILVGQTTGTSQTETITLLNPGSAALAYMSAVVTDNRISWLTQTPASGTVAAGGTSTMTLQANIKGLTPGLQHGVLRVAYIDGTLHTVDVYLVIPASAVSPTVQPSYASLQPAVERPAAYTPEALAQTCPGGTGMAVVLRNPEPGFQVTAQVPVPLQLQARDCFNGRIIRQLNGASAQVLIGSQIISLIDDGTGTWTGTWTPSAAASQVTLAARLDQYVGAAASVVSSQNTITGGVSAPPEGAAGVITSIVNGANSRFPGSVTPGSRVSIFGVGMGDDAAAPAPDSPFPVTLGGTQVLLQGQPLPLYFVNPTQIDALIPSGVNPNERQQLVVQRNGTRSPGIDVGVILQ